MKSKEFKLEGYELIERTVMQYEGTANRVLVPKGWIKVIVIRIE